MTVKVDITADQLLEAIQKLPKGEREKVTYQLRKEEGLKKLMQIAKEIQAEFPQDELPTMDEIVEMVDEVRQEIYNERKEAG